VNYNIDFPEELKALSIPKFKVIDKSLITINRPSWWNLSVPIGVLSTIFLMFISGNISIKGPYDEDYLLLIISLMVFVAVVFFSLNRVVIDFDKRCVIIKNYNPLVNLGRKFFKLPFLIPFDEIEKIYSDWSFWGKKIYNHYVILQTNAPYKFRIAIFQRKNQSIIFTAYLNKLIKHHSIHADAVSDTTLMP